MPKPLFGGKGGKPLPWHPLPHMEEWLATLNIGAGGRDESNGRLAMKHFGIFCKEEGIRHPEELERRHILHFQAHLQDRKLSSKYQATTLHYVRRYIQWMARRDYITQSPWERIHVEWGQRKRPRPINADDIAQVFETHRQAQWATAPFFYHRREVILSLLYGWGLTLSDLASLNVSTLDIRQDDVTIRYLNGTKSRLMPYSPELKGVINRYLQVRASKAVATDSALLIDGHGARMTTASIQKVLQELGARAGVTLNTSRMRDTFGYNLLENGVELGVVRDLLGHLRIEHVRAYDPKYIEAREALKKHVTPELTHLLGRDQQRRAE